MNILRKTWCRTYQAAFYIAQPLLPYKDPVVKESINDIPEILQANNISKVVFVTDKGLVDAGLAKRIEDVLASAKIDFTTYSDTVPNPTIENVEAVHKIYINTGAQGFVSLGGGSAMDCAKAAAARIARPNKQIPSMRGILKVHKKLPLIVAIPTTAGTGSEATVTTVITDIKKNYKYPISDFCLIPPYAIHDYTLTTGLPQKMTSTTGMDALTHAVEAYIGRSLNKTSAANAEEATRLIHKYLYRAYTNGNDTEARQKMLCASFCAGLAFSMSYVGYIHAVAHSLGGKYGTPHGLANSVLLPIILREYGECVYPKLARLARRSGVVADGHSIEETAKLFIEWIQEMNDKMNIPRIIEGINDEDIPEMAAHADAEANPTYPVPKLMDKKELERLYYLGKTGNAEN
ncbi:MAG: iron-containing alcohol dehydrogenase [Bacteroidales bacterium]|nr:iron-containing alcohol dehydrogenase [Bacteroidales bacterium]